MKYEIQRLDGRFTYRELFEYCIKFGGRMSNGSGPLHFTRAQKWFTDTYGWSAEIRQYSDIVTWISTGNRWLKGQAVDIPEECNEHWSWTNGYDDLRIYVANQQVLTMFTLKFSAND